MSIADHTTDHRHQTSATRSSLFSDTWEYCHGVNDLYLLKALRAVHGVQEQESVHFFKVLEAAILELCNTAVPLPPTGHKRLICKASQVLRLVSCALSEYIFVSIGTDVFVIPPTDQFNTSNCFTLICL